MKSASWIDLLCLILFAATGSVLLPDIGRPAAPQTSRKIVADSRGRVARQAAPLEAKLAPTSGEARRRLR